MKKEELQEKIKELETQKRQLLAQVNTALGKIEGKIEAYQEFIDEEGEDSE
jgi:carbamate kinase